MIIKGNSRGNTKFFTSHLLNAEQNERVEVKEIRGFSADTVPDAFKELSIMGAASRGERIFYHASINPEKGETLTPEQWQIAVEKLEHKLGLDDQPRFIIEHEKEGKDGELRTHQHIVWSRIDPDSMTLLSDSHNYQAHTQTARELEQLFDHEVVPVPAYAERSHIKDWEQWRGSESGIDPKQMKAEITQLYKSSDSGAAFQSALDEAGYVLAQGDRRDFVLVDRVGDVHSLARRIEGMKAAELRGFMSDVERQSLPTIAEAKSLQDTQATESESDSSPHFDLADNPKLAVGEKFAQQPDYISFNEIFASASAYLDKYGHTAFEFPEHHGRSKEFFHARAAAQIELELEEMHAEQDRRKAEQQKEREENLWQEAIQQQREQQKDLER
ncbi:MAG: hypothetical protein E6Q61_05410 [Nitrosomonas sp.]|nr:MAG: hypothetical protein E6Q61_05410 [Nitrosomonas sp.]